jgi:hypothetical protein
LQRSDDPAVHSGRELPAAPEPFAFVQSLSIPIPYAESESYSIAVPERGTITISGAYSESNGSSLTVTFHAAERLPEAR